LANGQACARGDTRVTAPLPPSTPRASSTVSHAKQALADAARLGLLAPPPSGGCCCRRAGRPRPRHGNRGKTPGTATASRRARRRESASARPVRWGQGGLLRAKGGPPSWAPSSSAPHRRLKSSPDAWLRHRGRLTLVVLFFLNTKVWELPVQGIKGVLASIVVRGVLVQARDLEGRRAQRRHARPHATDHDVLTIMCFMCSSRLQWGIGGGTHAQWPGRDIAGNCAAQGGTQSWGPTQATRGPHGTRTPALSHPCHARR
jgi:hypothetical protein